ncbi:hypothetical protein CAP35_03380 [Chitinophagaceae bacterium IBVUCB1]|nr:hypothetical protein CAP35_03380 [Chitinophagaceae bacterium IBVUCB1]
MIIQDWLITLSAKCTQSKYWMLWSALLLSCVALFFAFPSYGSLNPDDWAELFSKAAQPLVNSNAGDGSHDAKLSFRLLVPMLVRLLHLGIGGVLVIAALAGIANFYLVIAISHKVLQNRQQAFFVGLCTAFIYVGKCAFTELRGTIFDSIAIFFLLAALYANNVLIRWLLLLAGAWCDERALIASSLVWVYFFVKNNQRGIKGFFIIDAMGIYAAWVCYFAMRWWLTTTYGLKTDTDGTGIGVLLNQINNIPIGTWSALEGLWLLVFAAMLLLYKQKQLMQLALLIAASGIVLLAGLSVLDITRSVAYVLPAIFICLLIMSRYYSKANIDRILWFALLLCFAYPAYYTGGKSSIWWTYPLPLQLLR